MTVFDDGACSEVFWKMKRCYPSEGIDMKRDESIITDFEIVEQYGADKPLGQVLPHPGPHKDDMAPNGVCPGVTDEQILRDRGLDPARYFLERVWNLAGYKICRREVPA